MAFVLRFDQISDDMLPVVGGKALALSRMLRAELPIPHGLCLTADAYRRFVGETGLKERILLELNRKPFEEMRWEEIWDAALRIRNIFLRTDLPRSMVDTFRPALDGQFADRPVVVRSSAPEEDSQSASFAGLHESYVNVRGADAMLDHVRLVWASLWSDRALLYRRELRLDVENSAMAVVVQELVEGDASGVAFTCSPTDDTQAIVEAVHGLNQGMVDGAVEPDRWVLERHSGKIISHSPPERTHRMVRGAEGVRLEPLPDTRKNVPPLRTTQVGDVFDLARRAETLFGRPQDVEWTMRGDRLHPLQSRPVTTAVHERKQDKRTWYLGLRRSFENLKELRNRIENERVPAMIQQAEEFDQCDPSRLDDSQLAEEVIRRAEIHNRWVDIYWDEFIPFAHGTRLFGQIYNDAVRPADAFEFTRLLFDENLISLRRNRLFLYAAAAIRHDDETKAAVAARHWEGLNDEFRSQFRRLAEDCGCLAPNAPLNSGNLDGIVNLLLEAATGENASLHDDAKSAEQLRLCFLEKFEGEGKQFAADVLDLARASNRMRDDDNVYLGRLKSAKARAVSEGRRRLENRPGGAHGAEALDRALKVASELPRHKASDETGRPDPSATARQLVGQPAGPGIDAGPARVILDSADIFQFQRGEILVCDAIDPNMTFVVPLCAGIVERRGGMLIHGAIIAREYGIPCVTGIPRATGQIQTGDRVTVDGYLGLVTIDREG